VTSKSIIDDDDAISTEPVSEEQVAKLQEHIVKAGRDVATFCRSFGIETLDQLPAARFEQAIERADIARAHRGLSREEIDRLNREEIDRALDQDPFLRRVVQREKAGMDIHEAWDFTLAEELAKGRPWSSRLLEFVAESFLARYEPKLKARWERETQPARDRATIDALAERLKANNVRGYRGKAEELCAKIYGVTVHALRQRRYRPRRRKKV